jgi:hypothetical protein
MSVAVLAAALGVAGCGGSARTRPASAQTRAAIVKLMKAWKAPRHFPKGVRLHVWSVRVAASDPHFAGALIGLTGGPYGGGGKGDTAFVVAMENGGRWSVIDGPQSGFGAECTRPTAKAIVALVCPYQTSQ